MCVCRPIKAERAGLNPPQIAYTQHSIIEAPSNRGEGSVGRSARCAPTRITRQTIFRINTLPYLFALADMACVNLSARVCVCVYIIYTYLAPHKCGLEVCAYAALPCRACTHRISSARLWAAAICVHKDFRFASTAALSHRTHLSPPNSSIVIIVGSAPSPTSTPKTNQAANQSGSSTPSGTDATAAAAAGV